MSIFTPGSGVTIQAVSFTRFGKLAQLELQISHEMEWQLGVQHNIGTVAAGYRPAVNAGGTMSTNGVAVLVNNGLVYVRPTVNAELAAGSKALVRFTYLLR